MQLSLSCTRSKEKSPTAPITKGLICSPLQEKSSRWFCWTVVSTIAEEHLCRIRADRNITNNICSQAAQKEVPRQNRRLYVTFIHSAKVFNTVSRRGMKQIMKCFSCPTKLMNTIILLHYMTKSDSIETSQSLSWLTIEWSRNTSRHHLQHDAHTGHKRSWRWEQSLHKISSW